MQGRIIETFRLVLGEALHGAFKTGYDASGALAPKLNGSLLKMKIAAEREMDEYYLRKPKDRRQAAMVIQRHQSRQKKKRQATDGPAADRARAPDTLGAASRSAAASPIDGPGDKPASCRGGGTPASSSLSTAPGVAPLAESLAESKAAEEARSSEETHLAHATVEAAFDHLSRDLSA